VLDGAEVGDDFFGGGGHAAAVVVAVVGADAVLVGGEVPEEAAEVFVDSGFGGDSDLVGGVDR